MLLAPARHPLAVSKHHSQLVSVELVANNCLNAWISGSDLMLLEPDSFRKQAARKGAPCPLIHPIHAVGRLLLKAVREPAPRPLQSHWICELEKPTLLCLITQSYQCFENTAWVSTKLVEGPSCAKKLVPTNWCSLRLQNVDTFKTCPTTR